MIGRSSDANSLLTFIVSSLLRTHLRDGEKRAIFSADSARHPCDDELCSGPDVVRNRGINKYYKNKGGPRGTRQKKLHNLDSIGMRTK
jgi:hypothetical protein